VILVDYPLGTDVVQISEAQKAGVNYYDASGNPLLNPGEQEVVGFTSQGQVVNLAMQECGVTKPLDEQGSRTTVYEEDGSYVLSVWVMEPVPKELYKVRAEPPGTWFSKLAAGDAASDRAVEAQAGTPGRPA